MKDLRPVEVALIKYPRRFDSRVKSIDLDQYPILFASWNYSRDLLSEMNLFLSGFYAQMKDSNAFTVAVAGSFGRMEAFKHSDLDFMIFTTGGLEADSCYMIMRGIQECSKIFKTDLPDSNGVFGRMTPYDQLINRIGARDETIHDLAQRMLLLMEARPLYNDEIYQETIGSVLSGYLRGMENNPSKEALFMLNDVIRYFRSVCVHYQPDFWRQRDQWALHSVKLWHSRIIMYGGLLLAVLNASIKPDKVSYLHSIIALSPLERIVAIYQEASDPGYKKILKLYDYFLNRVQDDNFREQLKISYEQHYSSIEYQEMKLNSLALTRELARFVFGQSGRWTDQVMDYLIF